MGGLIFIYGILRAQVYAVGVSPWALGGSGGTLRTFLMHTDTCYIDRDIFDYIYGQSGPSLLIESVPSHNHILCLCVHGSISYALHSNVQQLGHGHMHFSAR